MFTLYDNRLQSQRFVIYYLLEINLDIVKFP